MFGNSPDEMTFYRHYALRENVANTLIMIQPSLDSYELDKCGPSSFLLSAFLTDLLGPNPNQSFSPQHQ